MIVKFVLQNKEEFVSDLRVLRSNAGYYIGRTIDDLPYSRESDYFRSKNSALIALSERVIINKIK